MRCAALFVLLLAWTAPLSAGVYSFTDKALGPTPGPESVQPLPLSTLKVALSDQVDVRNPNKSDNALRDQALQRKAALGAKIKAGTGTAEDKIDLSAVLIGLAEYQEAIQLLEPLIRDRERPLRGVPAFMAHANLGTAYQIVGESDRARTYLSLARDYLPKGEPPAGWTKEQLAWIREVEKQQLKLLGTRAKELADNNGKARPAEAVDDLFGVRFVGEIGNYEAGTLAAAERAKLPGNAMAITQQLLLWLPADSQYDARLFWLLGELLNAQGDVVAAHDVLDRCSWDRALNAAQLREHRQILQDALPKPASWLPETRKLVIVGASVVLAVLFLGYFQVREIVRRRQAP